MFIVGFISWWYGSGWKGCVIRAGEMLTSVYDYFSIDMLIRTLFSPFRQVSAGNVRGSIGVRMRAALDKLISRVIGAIMRTLVIAIGIVALICTGIVSGIKIVVWPLVPLIPFVSIVFAVAGWIPWVM